MSNVKKFSPASQKQKLVLTDTTTDVILVGGGAGGGKSATCLMKNLDGLNDPHFKCAIFRRSYPELKRPGGLIDESRQFYEPFGGEYKRQAMKWEFPSGAEIAFSAIGDDSQLAGWQGAQLTRVLIDEAADKWTEHQVLFLLSRMRSAHSKIHPQMILTCNPDCDSFLYDWVKVFLDEEGIPKEGTENRIRWFVTIDSIVYWADDPLQLFKEEGESRGMVYAAGLSADEIKKIPPELLFIPKSFRFIPCTVRDNPYLLPPINNSYLPNLLAQPYKAQLKFLRGSWLKVGESTGYFKREWVKMIDLPPTKDIVSRVRAWDIAATPEHEEGKNNHRADYTACVLMSRDKYGNYYVEHVDRFQKHPGKVIESIVDYAKFDGVEDVQVVVPRDSGAGGVAFNQYLIRTLAENGIPAKSAKVSGYTGKLARTLPFCSVAEAGCVYVVKGDWNEAWFSEMENFIPGNRNQKDD